MSPPFFSGTEAAIAGTPDRRSPLRCNIYRLPLRPEVAHGGEGRIAASRIQGPLPDDGCRYIDYAQLPPGTSIGDHTHPGDEEEFYLVLSGHGRMRLGPETFPVSAGDLLRNPPGGTHGLRNTGPVPLELFVFAVRRDAAGPRPGPAT
jgi:quercetin dioxygenase-like cupin family protein